MGTTPQSRVCWGPVRQELDAPVPDGRDRASAVAHARQAGAAHQQGDPFAADANAGLRQINVQARRSIGSFRGRVCGTDFNLIPVGAVRPSPPRPYLPTTSGYMIATAAAPIGTAAS
jgi:hypothetical protein